MLSSLSSNPGVAVVEAAGEAELQGRARVMAAVKRLDVIERDCAQAGHGPPVGMAVRVILVELDLEGPLAQLLVVVAAEGLGHIIERLVAEPLEVFGIESRFGNHLGQERDVSAQVVAMDGAREDGHFFVAGPVDRCGHWVKRIEELVIR